MITQAKEEVLLRDFFRSSIALGIFDGIQLSEAAKERLKTIINNMSDEHRNMLYFTIGFLAKNPTAVDGELEAMIGSILK